MESRGQTAYPPEEELLNREAIRLPLHRRIGEGMGGSPALSEVTPEAAHSSHWFN